MITPELIEEKFPNRYMAAIWTDSDEIARIEARRREYPYGRAPYRRTYAEVIVLQVHADHRRQGIATRLFAGVMEWARNNGYSHVAVEASAEPGTPGVPTYEALGLTARSVIYDIEVAGGAE